MRQMRGFWFAVVAGAAAVLSVPSCAAGPTFMQARTSGAAMPRSAEDPAALMGDSGNGAPGSAEQAGEVFILVPRAPGQPLDKIRSGVPDSASGIVPSSGGTTPAVNAGGQPAPDASESPVASNPESPCDQASSPGLFATAGGPVLATARGVYLWLLDSWKRIADPFPCGGAPAAIAPAGDAWYAAAADGIYQVGGQAPAWTKVASGAFVVDLDITPDGSFGLAVQEDGRPFLFDGASWTRQTYRFLSPLGGARVLSATESYVVGANRLYRGDARNVAWTLLAQPDSANPVAGLVVRRPGGDAASLVATTRAGLYRYEASGWVAELGPFADRYLGLPAFAGERGFVSDLGAAEGSAYRYSPAASWQAAPAPPAPLDSSAVLPNGDVLALSADGEAVYLLTGSTWRPLALP